MLIGILKKNIQVGNPIAGGKTSLILSWGKAWWMPCIIKWVAYIQPFKGTTRIQVSSPWKTNLWRTYSHRDHEHRPINMMPILFSTASFGVYIQSQNRTGIQKQGMIYQDVLENISTKSLSNILTSLLGLIRCFGSFMNS